MNILMVTSEARPFIKTGGLADVSFSLSKELALLGNNVSIILPFYQQIKDHFVDPYEKYTSLEINMSWRKSVANVYIVKKFGINYYLVENKQYFERNNVYGELDDGERFAYFTLVVKEMLIHLKDFKFDIIHVHDWHAGMLACVIKENQDSINIVKKTKFIFSIHNPAFQGMIDKEALPNCYNLSDALFENGNVRFKDRVSTLKSGIVYSDAIIAVSPTHREELLNPNTSMDLDGVLELRENDFYGILNGIDYDEFNPNNDKYIFDYDINNYDSIKLKNKEKLCSEYDLNINDQPLFGIISRLTWQKGIEILIPAIEEILKRGGNVFVLGSGEYKYERKFEELHNRYPHQLSIYVGYNDELAHRIYASSDIFLMPSLFEPCGLSQMVAQRYGTLPLVRTTGGLKDSVVCYNNENKDVSTGFGFFDYNGFELIRTCHFAYETYFNKDIFNTLIRNAMKIDNSWKNSALKYLDIYNNLIEK